jgi:hypothetical protein
VVTYARLRLDCERIGHALSRREHNADRWIAATAVRLGVPLVSNHGIFHTRCHGLRYRAGVMGARGAALRRI